MKAICLGLAVWLAATAPSSAADVYPPGTASAPGAYAPTPHPLPLALRTLSRRSAAVLAADACWRGCTTQCGWHFQHCLRTARLDDCGAHNDACELTCLKHCRLKGGPLVSWTDY
jgi:hypothetical protein